MDLKPVVLSIPLYFLLIGLEMLIQFFGRSQIYRLNDAVTNISCGMMQQVSNAFIKVALVAVYEITYQHLAILEIRPSLWSYAILFVLVDFCYYWAHRKSHEISLFWGGHCKPGLVNGAKVFAPKLEALRLLLTVLVLVQLFISLYWLGQAPLML